MAWTSMASNFSSRNQEENKEKEETLEKKPYQRCHRGTELLSAFSMKMY